jgi:hypothetical protein
MRHVFLLMLLAGPLAGSAAAQSAVDVDVPPLEVGAAFSYDLQRKGTADLRGGAGAIVSVDGNINPYVAVAAQIAESPRMRTVMAGGRVSTSFFREGAGGPGRFFADLLAGTRDGQATGGGATVQLGVGADVLVVGRGLSLHWALDYLWAPGARHDFAGGRIAIGLVAGPRIRHG